MSNCEPEHATGLFFEAEWHYCTIVPEIMVREYWKEELLYLSCYDTKLVFTKCFFWTCGGARMEDWTIARPFSSQVSLDYAHNLGKYSFPMRGLNLQFQKSLLS